MNMQYREACNEVLDILKHTKREKVDLIPVTFINYLEENALNDYVVNIDYSKSIRDMNLKLETRDMIVTICMNWWWTTNQKEEYNRLVRERERMR